MIVLHAVVMQKPLYVHVCIASLVALILAGL